MTIYVPTRQNFERINITLLCMLVIHHVTKLKTHNDNIKLSYYLLISPKSYRYQLGEIKRISTNFKRNFSAGF